MKNKKVIVQSLWIGYSLSSIEQLAIKSFLHYGHDFHLYVYNEVENIPEGTVIKDANSIISQKYIFTYNNGSYAGFADWFRWELLYQRGNYWVDTDMICLSPFNFDEEIIFGLESSEYAGSGVLKFPIGYHFSRFMANICKNPNTILKYDSIYDKLKKIKRFIKRNKRSNISWGEAGGPVGFTKALHYFDLFQLGKPIDYFYPINSKDWFKIYDQNLDFGDWINSSFAVHLWNEMARRKPEFDKNQIFPKNSFIEVLKSIYN